MEKKAVLSNRIYLNTTPELQEAFKKELTYEVPNYGNPLQPIQIRNYGVIRQGLMTLPIGRIDLIPKDYDVKDKRVLVPAEYPDFNGTLRASQQEVYDAVDDNAIVNAKPSWGKTFTALALAKKLGQKALIVVHTVPLRNQWAREVKKIFGFEPGIIGSGKFNISTPVVVGNVQSIYNCIPQIQKEFGTVILDEMHHVSSNTFSRVVDTSYARYKIGLSGTLKRKDGRHVVFTDYFGNHILKPPPENSMQPEVDIIFSGIPLPDGHGPGAWAYRVNALMEMPVYRNLVGNLADIYSKKRKTLIVADRVEFLQTMAAERENAVCVTGGGDLDERDKKIHSINTTSNQLWGTTSIFKEGISEDILACLILATPINNLPMLEQLVGRIQRIKEGKLPPKLVDIVLTGYTANNQFQERLGFYLRMGYKINYIENSS